MNTIAEYVDVTTLRSLPLAQKAELPPIACVYLIVDASDQIHYVGGTKNLRNRWTHHQKYTAAQQLQDPRIAYLEISPHLIWEIEALLIRVLQPQLNLKTPSESELVPASLLSSF